MTSTLGHALGFLLVVVTAGCVHTYERIRPDTALVQPRLSRQVSLYVATCQDGRYGKIEYPGSGISTAHSVRSAFLRHVSRVGMGSVVETEDQAVAHARRDGYTHVVVPTIVHWEDRATEWSGKPDRIEVKLTLIEVGSLRLLDVVHIKGKSRWATFGGDDPQDLLPEPVSAWADGLFGASTR